MKVIEHIEPKGECTLKVKVWLLDKRIEFQVLEQKKRKAYGNPLWILANAPLRIASGLWRAMNEQTIWLRGEYVNRDKDITGLDFHSNTERDAYYAKMKVALATAAEAMK